MSTRVHALRDMLREALSMGERQVGIFIKLPSVDGVEMAAATGLDFVVVDLEHSTLSEYDAIAMVRHADVCGVAALVRVPYLDSGLVNRLLENGAAGIQLSTLATVTQAADLRDATAYAPRGSRSLSLSHRSAGFGRDGPGAYVDSESASPPVLVGQIESTATQPLNELLQGLDVCFVGTTDLSVNLGTTGPELIAAVANIESAAATAGVAFGGWASSPDAVDELGLGAATYLVVGSDAQVLSRGFAEIRAATKESF